MKTMKVKLECFECGQSFRGNIDTDPRCPRCGSVDLDIGVI